MRSRFTPPDGTVRAVDGERDDAVMQELRAKISDNDREIVRALNRRLDLVLRIKRYKESRGLEFVDRSREEWMLRDLARANRGPLSADGLRRIFEDIFELTKRELADREK
jgi:chorismate mutase